MESEALVEKKAKVKKAKSEKPKLPVWAKCLYFPLLGVFAKVMGKWYAGGIFCIFLFGCATFLVIVTAACKRNVGWIRISRWNVLVLFGLTCATIRVLAKISCPWNEEGDPVACKSIALGGSYRACEMIRESMWWYYLIPWHPQKAPDKPDGDIFNPHVSWKMRVTPLKGDEEWESFGSPALHRERSAETQAGKTMTIKNPPGYTDGGSSYTAEAEYASSISNLITESQDNGGTEVNLPVEEGPPNEDMPDGPPEVVSTSDDANTADTALFQVGAASAVVAPDGEVQPTESMAEVRGATDFQPRPNKKKGSEENDDEDEEVDSSPSLVRAQKSPKPKPKPPAAKKKATTKAVKTVEKATKNTPGADIQGFIDEIAIWDQSMKQEAGILEKLEEGKESDELNEIRADIAQAIRHARTYYTRISEFTLPGGDDALKFWEHEEEYATSKGVNKAVMAKALKVMLADVIKCKKQKGDEDKTPCMQTVDSEHFWCFLSTEDTFVPDKRKTWTQGMQDAIGNAYDDLGNKFPVGQEFVAFRQYYTFGKCEDPHGMGFHRETEIRTPSKDCQCKKEPGGADGKCIGNSEESPLPGLEKQYFFKWYFGCQVIHENSCKYVVNINDDNGDPHPYSFMGSACSARFTADTKVLEEDATLICDSWRHTLIISCALNIIMTLVVLRLLHAFYYSVGMDTDDFAMEDGDIMKLSNEDEAAGDEAWDWGSSDSWDDSESNSSSAPSQKKAPPPKKQKSEKKAKDAISASGSSGSESGSISSAG